jgi:DNA topoisomerase I
MLTETHHPSEQSKRTSHGGHKPTRLRRVKRGSLTIVRAKEKGAHVYLHQNGREVGEAHRERIDKLAIPPAWTDVAIAADPRAHLQAIGHDEASRCQYLYHPDWVEVRDRRKLRRLLQFAEVLPRLRLGTRKQLRRRTPDGDFAMAVAITLLDTCAIRAGHEEYARASGGRGCATLRKGNVIVSKEGMALSFRGKGGKRVEKTLTDQTLIRAINLLLTIPGPRLLQFVDEAGGVHPLTAATVNRGIKKLAEVQISAKDFRMFAASARAFELLFELAGAEESRPASEVKAAMSDVAELLVNTPTVTRTSYVPSVLVASFLAQRPIESLFKGRPMNGMSRSEAALVRFLRRVA